MFYNNWVSPPLMNADKSEATYSLRLRTCEPMASKENDGQKENIGWTTSDIATRLNEKITSLPEDDPSREQSLVILGAHYQLEFQTTRSIDYLSRGLEICQLRHAIANSTYRGENLHSWAWTLERRFELTGSKTDLDDASIKCREALEIMPLNDPQRTPCLIILGRIEKFRFDMTGLASDLMTAIAANEAAFAMVAEDHPDRPICLNMLSIVILERGKRTGSLEDLDRAVCLCQSAWDSTRDKGYKINRLADFAMALATRSEITRKKDDLDEGIRLMETAKPTTPDSRIYLLCRLGNCYHQRFDYGEDINDLYAAITTMEGVIDAFPDGNDRSGLLSNLGSAFERLYIRFGSIEDLQRAILAHEAAVRGIANNSLQKSARLNHLSNALQVRAYFTTSIQDLDKAISAAEEAVGLIQDVFGHVDPVNTLSLAHYHRFQFTHSTSDLDRAIDSLNSIIRALPMEHPAYATLNENLGIILLSRFEQTGSMEDFDISIATIRGIENSRLSRAVRLGNLGLAYNLRFQRTRQIDDWNLAVEAYSKAAETDGAPPSNRVSYARKAAALLSLYDTERAKDFLKLAVELVPSANPITLSQPSQQHIMSQFPNTASSAAALIIECGEAPYEALRLLEIGRGVAFGSQLDIRSDITDLEERNMTIASRFNDIRDQLDVFADMASVAMLESSSDCSGDPSRARRSRASDRVSPTDTRFSRPDHADSLRRARGARILGVPKEGPMEPRAYAPFSRPRARASPCQPFPRTPRSRLTLTARPRRLPFTPRANSDRSSTRSTSTGSRGTRRISFKSSIRVFVTVCHGQLFGVRRHDRLHDWADDQQQQPSRGRISSTSAQRDLPRSEHRSDRSSPVPPTGPFHRPQAGTTPVQRLPRPRRGHGRARRSF